MKLSDNKYAIDWLRQFDVREVHSARMLLDALKLVSFAECERGIFDALKNIASNNSGAIALITADKKQIDPATQKPGSEGRLAHLFQNIQRVFGGRILLRPSIEEMRGSSVNHVIVADDLVCSGQRIEDFWDAWTSTDTVATKLKRGKIVQLTRKRGTLRSWLSYGYCKLWLVSYAAYEPGIERILKSIPYLARERTIFELTLRANAVYWPPEVADLIERIGVNYSGHGSALGGGNLNIPLVFQHGCPDNCPKLLWEDNWNHRALFPNRAVPTELYPCFDGLCDGGRGATLLMNAGQSVLSRALIREMRNSAKNQQYLDILTVLGLVLSGYAIRNLGGALLREESQIERLLETARELHLLDGENRVTAFGRDIVSRSRKSFLTQNSRIQGCSASGDHYVPLQYRHKLCGAQRNSRNEPETKS